MSILITGANRGIGRALFDRYQGLDRPVQGTSRSGAAPFLTLDVTDETSLTALARQLADQPVSLLICNAGVYLDKGQSLDTGYAPALWQRTFATNVTGVFRTIQTLLPNLRAGGDARIAIISSGMASQQRAPGGSYIYRASKAAVLNLGRNLACDLRADNIAVGIYHPGWVQTDMGGARAKISPDTAARGLIDRFDDLSLDSTGCFEGWNGAPLPF
jgi:NAD(P)-dependent dehydrogenase (short-subunit alcohol dehydrogenase family)